MQGSVEIDELRENLGVKLKYIANSADSTSQSATPNSSADVADK